VRAVSQLLISDITCSTKQRTVCSAVRLRPLSQSTRTCRASGRRNGVGRQTLGKMTYLRTSSFCLEPREEDDGERRGGSLVGERGLLDVSYAKKYV